MKIRKMSILSHWCNLFILFVVPIALGNAAVIYPNNEHNIGLKEGGNTTIYCILTTDELKNYSVNDITFVSTHNNGNRSERKPLNEDHFKIGTLNSSTKYVEITNAPKMDEIIFCKLNGSIVAERNLKADKELTKLKAFHCYTYNMELLRCNLTTESYIYSVKLEILLSAPGKNGYNLSYTTSSWDKYTYVVEANRNTGFNFLPRTQQLNITSIKRHHDTIESYPESYQIDTYIQNIPAPINKLTTNSFPKTHSVIVEWEAPNNYLDHSEFCSPETSDVMLTYYAIVSSENGTWQRTIAYDDLNLSSNCPLRSFNNYIRINATIKDLPFADMWYDFRVCSRLSYKEDRNTIESKYWSEWTSIEIHTEKTIPDIAPETPFDAYFISGDQSRATLYWKKLEDTQRNDKAGPLKYEVVSNHSNKAIRFDISPIEINYSGNYTKYEIRSINSIGKSINASFIIIPKRSMLMVKPMEVQKMLKGNNYTLLWKYPDGPNINDVSFTILWCTMRNQQANACERDTVNFTTVMHKNYKGIVPASQKYSYKFEHMSNDNSLNFAVSANTKNFASSGLLWAKCSAHEPDNIGELTRVSRDKSGWNYLSYEWDHSCQDAEIIKYYLLSYCNAELTAEGKHKCVDEWQNITIPNKDIRKYNFTGLEAYTTYNLKFQACSETRCGDPDKIHSATTSEGPPEPPFNVQISNVTNTTMDISWTAPRKTNGKLSRYEILIKEITEKKDGKESRDETLIKRTTKKIENVNLLNMEDITYTLENLMPFVNYHVSVSACTVPCSNYSDEAMERTKIGEPDEIQNPGLANNTVLWQPPELKGGLINYYELLINSTTDRNFTITGRVNDTRCTFSFSLCGSSENQYEIYIRAVNVFGEPYEDDSNFGIDDSLAKCKESRDDNTLSKFLYQHKSSQYYYGPWSRAYVNQCSQADAINYNTIYNSVIILLVICTLIIVYYKFKKTTDIKAEMPPWLLDAMHAPDIKNDGKQSKTISFYENNERKNLLDNGSVASSNQSNSKGSNDNVSTNESNITSINSDTNYAFTDSMVRIGGINHTSYCETPSEVNLLNSGNGSLTSFNPNTSSSLDNISSTNQTISTQLDTDNYTVMSPKRMLGSSDYVLPSTHSDYIKNSAPTSPAATNLSNGYVDHSVFMRAENLARDNPPNNPTSGGSFMSGGYTSLGMLASVQNDNAKSKTPLVATDLRGYVTQKQLNLARGHNDGLNFR